jgi:hypothetical protein
MPGTSLPIIHEMHTHTLRDILKLALSTLNFHFIYMYITSSAYMLDDDIPIDQGGEVLADGLL